MIETNRIEFKRELTRELDIEKEVVAFLNYREGGIIYIGVDDNGKPVDIKDIDGDMLAIKNRIRDGILPTPMGLFDVTVERIDEKGVGACKPRVLLVTSAWHMRRSVLMYRKYAPSLEIIPAATDYEATVQTGRPFSLKDLWPDATMFYANSYILKEYIGYWGYRLLR